MKTTQYVMTKLDMITKVGIGMALLTPILMAGPSTSPPRTLEDQVRHEILMTPRIGVFDSVAFSIDNGVVTLSGQLTQPYKKDDLERAVKSVEGVTSVNDRIEVLPLSPFDDQIRSRTLRTLLRSESLGKYFQGVQPSIRIIVKNGNVTLDGVVLDNADRQFANMAANSVPGVFSVTDNLRTEK